MSDAANHRLRISHCERNLAHPNSFLPPAFTSRPSVLLFRIPAPRPSTAKANPRFNWLPGFLLVTAHLSVDQPAGGAISQPADASTPAPRSCTGIDLVPCRPGTAASYFGGTCTRAVVRQTHILETPGSSFRLDAIETVEPPTPLVHPRLSLPQQVFAQIHPGISLRLPPCSRSLDDLTRLDLTPAHGRFSLFDTPPMRAVLDF